MTTLEITRSLATTMQRKERATLRKGQRVAITVRQITAHGVIVAGYNSSAPSGAGAIVTLDGTGQTVRVTTDLLTNERYIP